jgi:hypothetical protein
MPPRTYERIDPQLTPITAGVSLLRIYAPEPYNTGPATFRDVGPINRFDHHRVDKRGPRRHRGRGVLYAGTGMVCCVGEYFGDQGSISRAGNRLARLTVTSPLNVLDLRETAATGAGTIPAIGGIGERRITEAWSRWWYEHPQLVGVDGLLYKSAHSGRDAVALWERAEGRLEATANLRLEDDAIRDDLEIAAGELHLPIL